MGEIFNYKLFVYIAGLSCVAAAIYAIYQLMYGKTTKDKTKGIFIFGVLSTIFYILKNLIFKDDTPNNNTIISDTQDSENTIYDQINNFDVENDNLHQQNANLQNSINSGKEEIQNNLQNLNTNLNSAREDELKNEADIIEVANKKHEELKKEKLDKDAAISNAVYDSDESVEIISNIVNGKKK